MKSKETGRREKGSKEKREGGRDRGEEKREGQRRREEGGREG